MTLTTDDKSVGVVIEFIFIDGTLAAPTFNGDNRFTNLESPISGFDPGEPDAAPDPLLKLELAQIQPGMKERTAKVTMSDKSDLAMLMRREYSMPKITCRARLYTYDTSAGPTGVTVSITYLLEGNCVKATAAPGGRQGLIEILVDNIKISTKQPSGVVITPQCGWTFGDPKTCQVDVVSRQESGQLTAISQRGFQVTVTGLTAPSIHYWVNGFLFHDGVAMGIRDWDGADEFLLFQRVSYAMSSASLPIDIEASPGCRLVPTDCRFYDNEERFYGLGLVLPTFNPLFEKGPE